ncbi:protein FAR1-RELATED SEQUENCE 5-like [Olea europaea var. sylvestris]|uniref:protein FAR1-RELATED SEQUENCE 5-like n=1 Tax=Olea europaea var. sylvestris TaxID=158386 RepID=UPI000C1CDEF2|nr:protein FAR1-RELATED SEQUENCE 5-like [Olea europaea var. sylvestris]
MIKKYNLYDNEWLAGLYDNKERWVPCFLKTTFWTGMSTTQRSESINAFFDGYVHSKTTLKQFVEQYERALRNKVEKEFQADFKSYSQMVPCAMHYEMEKQYQTVYTISKFREVQEEFVGKVYCDLICASEGFLGMTYEVHEDVVYEERSTKKTFFVSFQRDKCEFTCSCHFFEFRGIICRHAIAVLIRNNVKKVPDRYILKRWRRDVSRAHTRVAVNYAGLVSTPGQLMYDKMCQRFTTLANMTADDSLRASAILDWIDMQCEQTMASKSSHGSNVIPLHSTQISSRADATQGTGSGSVRDPECAKRKGRPRTLRKKCPLESSSKNVPYVLGKQLTLELNSCVICLFGSW